MNRSGQKWRRIFEPDIARRDKNCHKKLKKKLFPSETHVHE